jgi:hypothetical protein
MIYEREITQRYCVLVGHGGIQFGFARGGSSADYRHAHKFGVDAAVVDMRVANLTDSELRQLAQKIDTAPAGGSIWAIIGVAAVVLLILELTHVIDWIKNFP